MQYRLYWKKNGETHSKFFKDYRKFIRKLKNITFDEVWFYFYYPDKTENKSIKIKSKKDALWVAKSFHDEE